MADPYGDILQELQSKGTPAQPSEAQPKTPAGKTPYDEMLNKLGTDQLLSENPGWTGSLKEFFKFFGHRTAAGLAMDFGMPIDNLNAAGRFIQDYPAVANKLAAASPALFGGPLAAGAIKQRLKPEPIETGSSRQIMGLMNEAGIPTSSPEEEGVTTSAAHWGGTLGEFFGANLPFAFLNPAAGSSKYVPEVAHALNPAQVGAAVSKLGLSPKTWLEGAKELAPAGHLLKEIGLGGLGPGSGAVIGSEALGYAGGEDYRESGKAIGALVGNIRARGLETIGKAAKGGYSWFHDFLGFGTGSKSVAGKSLAVTTQDLPGAITRIAESERHPVPMAPGMREEIITPDGRILPGATPTDLVTGDQGLIAFRRHLSNIDHRLAGDYDLMHKTGTVAALEHGVMFPESYPGQHGEQVAATLGNRDWALRQQMEHRALQAADLSQQAQERAFTGVEKTPEQINQAQANAATALRKELVAADEDTSALVDTLWQDPGVVKAARRDMGPAYDLLNTMRAEAAATADAGQNRFPKDVINSFFDHEGDPVFGPGTTLKQVIELDSAIQYKIRTMLNGNAAPDHVYVSYLQRLSKALNESKYAAGPGEDGPALRRAIQATKDYHDTYHRGPVGQVLGRDSSGSARVPDGDTIRRFMSNGPKGVDSFNALMRSLEGRTGQKVPLNNTEPRQVLAPYLRQEFYNQTMRNGVFSLKDAQTWMKNNAGPMQHFPELRDEFNAAIRSEGKSIQVQEWKHIEETELNKSKAALYLKGKPGALFNGAVDAPDQYAATRELVQATRFDTTGRATKGLVQMALDRMISDAFVGDRSLLEGGYTSGRKVAQWQQENPGVIRALDEAIPGVRQRFDELANTFLFLDRFAAAPRIPTPQEQVGGGMMRTIAARVMGAHIFAKFFGGGEGVGQQTAAIGSSTFKTLAQALTPEQSMKLIRKALAEPKLFADLTKNWNQAPPQQQAAAAKRLSAYLYSIGVPLAQPYINPPDQDKNTRARPDISGYAPVPDLGVR